MNVRFSSVIELFYGVTVESAEQSDQLKQSLKEEKQTRKKLESKVDHIEEELNDLRHEKESLERVRALSDTRQNCFSGICQYTDYTRVSLSTWFCSCTLPLAPLFHPIGNKNQNQFCLVRTHFIALSVSYMYLELVYTELSVSFVIG